MNLFYRKARILYFKVRLTGFELHGITLIAVEDNKVGEFKPAIYREKLTDIWADGFISDNDSRRLYQPLKDQYELISKYITHKTQS